MWDAISTRIPASLLSLVHEGLYRGTSYALLLALTALLASFTGDDSVRERSAIVRLRAEFRSRLGGAADCCEILRGLKAPQDDTV